jgi:hypothetical protein
MAKMRKVWGFSGLVIEERMRIDVVVNFDAGCLPLMAPKSPVCAESGTACGIVRLC